MIKKGESWQFNCSCPKNFTGSKCEGMCILLIIFVSILAFLDRTIVEVFWTAVGSFARPLCDQGAVIVY